MSAPAPASAPTPVPPRGDAARHAADRGGTWRWAARRLLQLVPTLFGVTLLVFFLFHVVGGSPAATVLGKNASAEAIAEWDHQHGWDRPLAVQYVSWLGELARGDLGESLEWRRPVADVLRDGALVSLSLTVPILLAGTAAALLIGLLCAAFAGRRPDRLALGAVTALMSVNYVIWVAAGQWFLAYKWRLFPLWGWENGTYLALPVLVGVVSGLGPDVRFYRAVVLEEIRRPFVRAAVARGLSPARVLFRHVLRNALVPVVTNMSLSVPFLFAGSVLLESFYGIPGLGGVGLAAVHSSDFATLRAVVLLSALLYQLSNLAADLLVAWLDPTVRLGAGPAGG